jgi:hypothetical protein
MVAGGHGIRFDDSQCRVAQFYLRFYIHIIKL